MGGSKKSKSNKGGGCGLGPASRKEHAKKALQNRFKSDSELKQLVKTIQHTEREITAIQAEKEAIIVASLARYTEKMEAEIVRNTRAKKHFQPFYFDFIPLKPTPAETAKSMPSITHPETTSNANSTTASKALENCEKPKTKNIENPDKNNTQTPSSSGKASHAAQGTSPNPGNSNTAVVTVKRNNQQPTTRRVYKRNPQPVSKDVMDYVTQLLATVSKRGVSDRKAEAERLRDWQYAFVALLSKQKVAEDKIKLLHIHNPTVSESDKDNNKHSRAATTTSTTSKSVASMKEEKRGLEKTIEDMQRMYKKISELDCERQKHEKFSKLTLEEYIAFKHQSSNENIESLSRSLSLANREARRVNEVLEERRAHTKRIAEEIAKNTMSSPMDHQLYKEVAEQNKVLLKQLDALTKKRNIVRRELKHAQSQVSYERQARDDATKGDDGDGATVRAEVTRLQQHRDQTVMYWDSGSSQLDELRHQCWLTRNSARNLEDSNARTAETIRRERTMLVKARMQVDEAKAYNDTIISDIESRAHEKTEDIQTRLDQQQQQHLQQQQQLQQQLHTLRSF